MGEPMTKRQIRDFIYRMERPTLISVLENAGIQCYDSEKRGILAKAVFENFKDGTISWNDIIETEFPA